MEKCLLIFDYFKEAFDVNKKNKGLYKPQILLAVLSSIFVVMGGAAIYQCFNIMEIKKFDFDIIKIWDFSPCIIAFFAILIVFSIMVVIFEAGIFNMYHKAVNVGGAQPGDFREGVSKYFLYFIGVNLLTVFAWIVFLPFYFILGFMTIGAGFVLIPILINIYLSMWKVSIVSEQSGIINSLKNSIKFTNRNFLPFVVFMLIVTAFISPVRQSSGINVVSDINNVVKDFNQKGTERQNKPNIPDTDSNIQNKDFNIPDDGVLSPNKSIDDYNQNPSGLRYEDKGSVSVMKLSSQSFKGGSEDYQDYESVKNRINENLSKYLRGASFYGLFKILMISGISVVSIATFLYSLIQMVFKVFFQLSMFIVYKKGFSLKSPENQEVIE